MGLEPDETLDGIFFKVVRLIGTAIEGVVNLNKLTDQTFTENTAPTEEGKFFLLETFLEQIDEALKKLQGYIGKNPQEELTQTKTSFFAIRLLEAQFVLAISGPALEQKKRYISEENPDQKKIDSILNSSVNIEEEFTKLLLSPIFLYNDTLLNISKIQGPTVN